MSTGNNSNGNARKRRFFNSVPTMGVAILIVVFIGLAVDTRGAGSPDNFFSDVMRMDNVAVKIHQNYVEEVSSKELIDHAIQGMLQALDPHTSYFEAKEFEDLRMQTEGKFGGLGIQISIRDKVLTVMTPISGTPAHRAGIQSGDQIIRIDGVSTRGYTTDRAVSKLRGDPGTEVRLLIRRSGEAQDLEFVIKREIIHIKSVPFYGVLENRVGYITLQQFSQEAGSEVEKAIRDLVRQGITGLIFDLRHNPGGLLPQAIEVSEKFLPRNSLVVSTRGRVRNQNRDFHSSRNAVLPANIPLVVLVDRASASASEIVAGAIQDWDRGVVLGDTTFGKGSVQSVLQLDAVNHIKLTTAFYYTPAGRNINRPENLVRNRNNEEEDEEEETDDEEGVEVAETPANERVAVDTAIYRTKGGRIVRGGGGIVPDTVVTRAITPPAVRSLLLRDMFFQFANAEYVRLQKRGVTVTPTYTPDATTIAAFYAHLDSTEFTFKSVAQLEFDAFKIRSGVTEDSTIANHPNPYLRPPRLSDDDMARLRAATDAVDSILVAESRAAIKNSDAEIRRLIRNALLVRALGQDHEAVYRTRLENDEVLAAALGLLRDRDAYAQLLEVRPENRTEVAPASSDTNTTEEPGRRRRRQR